MAKVSFGSEEFEVEEHIYRDMFFDCMIDDAPMTLYEYMEDLDDGRRKDLTNYIVYRLAQIDPGHVPDREEDED